MATHKKVALPLDQVQRSRGLATIDCHNGQLGMTVSIAATSFFTDSMP